MSAPWTVAPVGPVGPAGDPLFVRDSRDHAPDTAQEWVLHLKARHDGLEDLLERVHRYGALLDVAELVGGDAWREWCEPAVPECDVALHVYFAAPTPGSAAARARAMVRALELGPHDAALSTAGDWSEGAPLLAPGWERYVRSRAGRRSA
ncbi:hypothetical protein [Aeromicrobium sp. Leaf291]|uniref:hypothetical protein n=1 Tax=Aeromicrobium sp. Leaf291 TaxID=1736325 RepID=UPI0006F8C862|nr:hypothetical protein [Aeromicrobium sp. Leaf291]KQP81588.1 hypothetical protein ASF35_16285 [Aeromicrobium sp. Leaf291]